MAIWIVFALMTGLAVLAVLWPLSRHASARAKSVDEAALYRAQVAEIDRDRDRGLLDEASADAARAEAARRLLRAARTDHERGDGDSEPALRRRRAASAIALSMVPLVAIAAYGALGSPGLPSQPLTARVASQSGSAVDLASAVARIENHLASHPDDARGWEVLAPVYLKAGRADDAVKAYQNLIRIGGPSPERLADYGEAIVISGDGVVDADARKAFEAALAGDPSSAKARFYLAVAAEQDGDKAGAAKRLSDLVASAPPDAPWLPAVRQRLARLSGAPMPATAPLAGMSDEQKVAIRGMVDGLAQRLSQDGSDAEGWLRLVRSYMVLGETDKAAAALDEGRKALAQRPADLARLDALGADLKLPSAPAGDTAGQNAK